MAEHQLTLDSIPEAPVPTPVLKAKDQLDMFSAPVVPAEPVALAFALAPPVQPVKKSVVFTKEPIEAHKVIMRKCLTRDEYNQWLFNCARFGYRPIGDETHPANIIMESFIRADTREGRDYWEVIMARVSEQYSAE